MFHEPADLSAAREIRATFTNCTDQALRIALKIHAETEQGRLPDRGWRIPPVESQRERAECYERYLNAAVDNPNYVGAHWFCWRDCPITGQVNEGANAQCGLVSTADIPYSELVQAIRSVSRTMYERRFRGF